MKKQYIILYTFYSLNDVSLAPFVIGKCMGNEYVCRKVILESKMLFLFGCDVGCDVGCEAIIAVTISFEVRSCTVQFIKQDVFH